MKLQILFLTIYLLIGVIGSSHSQEIISRDSKLAMQFGLYELTFHTADKKSNPFYELSLKVTFTLPGGESVTVDGFGDGGTMFKARAYCKETGFWKWKSSSNDPHMDGLSGSFEVVPSGMPGKLRIHPKDPYQF